MPNKKPMGLPEKQFQSWNTFAKSYAYTKTLIKREKPIIFFLRIMAFICKNFDSLQQMMICTKLSCNWPNVSGEDFWISSKYFCYLVIIVPFFTFEKNVSLTPLSLHHLRMLYTNFGWTWPSDLGEDETVNSLQTDDRRSEKLAWAFSQRELKVTT